MLIEVVDAAKRFGDALIFENVSAVFQPGTVTALTGPSGSGKSTLLAAIAGLESLSSGSIIWRNRGRSTKPLFNEIAWIPQGVNLLSGRSAVDNVMLGSLAQGMTISDARKNALKVLEEVGLEGKGNVPVARLSGGEAQRVAIGRAVASGRPVILADEPTANLDRANTDQVASVIAMPRSDKTIIIASHDPFLVDSTQHVVALRKGFGGTR